MYAEYKKRHTELGDHSVCLDSFSGIKSAITFSLSLALSLSLSLFKSLLGYLYLFLTYLPFVPFLSTLLLSSLIRQVHTSASPSPSFYFSFTLFPFSPSSLIFLLCPSSFVLEKCHRQSAHPLTLLVAIHLLHHAQHLHFIAPNAST